MYTVTWNQISKPTCAPMPTHLPPHSPPTNYKRVVSAVDAGSWAYLPTLEQFSSAEQTHQHEVQWLLQWNGKPELQASILQKNDKKKSQLEVNCCGNVNSSMENLCMYVT